MNNFELYSKVGWVSRSEIEFALSWWHSKVHHKAWNSSYGSMKPWIDQMDESNEEYKFDVDETFQSAWNEIIDGFAWTKVGRYPWSMGVSNNMDKIGWWKLA